MEDDYVDNDGYDEEYETNQNDFQELNSGPNYMPGPMYRGRGGRGGRGGWFKDYRNAHYNNAYGNYSGGYGPGGGFRPPPPYYNGPSPFDGPPFEGPTFDGPPTFMMGRGFGPEGPPVKRNYLAEKVTKYLTRCGVPSEYLRNLPRQLLKLIEPEYCGLCGLGFDSYAMSRMHYISKNHLKNQKKWVKQANEDGNRRPREDPLKSRELYCELCDVQITSKSHSEAHYAGKPHRSIVEGRRNPKNPTLLQKCMKDRVDQLIRREKKFLKTIEDPNDMSIDHEMEKKSTPPELYCDICKTAVTCSEQMTMHLNGKRHLNKEKQHILKLMRGDTAGSKKKVKEEQGTENTAEDEEEEPIVIEDEENQKEKTTGDDWENNGEKWDDASIY